ncbi:MAG TPA: choice-of-anchor tandem repeat GloVer-containing protein [Chthonomonas sp.]|uniref:choice-of-anchor tandem repeat GloVer-containing protein n=1 Tax=Chthonomonas sp. TaxID=2282153 RepID=UPI002B4B2107|nr:choice-of-anchor tandem repeat GloVer-containing protein [Chthonomonas sp.]HLI49085.1 choice-of-anchor tandem repeat GloVer-containing protein [Chthonomonas sp.]
MYPNIQEVLLPFQPNKIAFEKLLLKEAYPAPVDGFSFFFFKHHTLEHGHFFSFLPPQYLDTFDWDTDDHWTDFCAFLSPRISDLQTLSEIESQTIRAKGHHHQRIVSQWLAHHPQACILWQYGDPDFPKQIAPFNYLLSYDADLYLLLTHQQFRTYGENAIGRTRSVNLGGYPSFFVLTLLPPHFPQQPSPAALTIPPDVLEFMAAHTQLLGLAGVFQGTVDILWQRDPQPRYPFTPRYGLCTGASPTGHLTTLNGGQAQQGLLLNLSPNQPPQIVHPFAADPAGQPVAGLRRAPNGTLYGITLRGGDFDTGTLYALDPNTQTVEVLYQGEEGGPRHPIGLPVWTEEGGLYGVSLFGGQHNAGTLYRFDLQSKQMQILHSFAGPEGAHPLEALVLGADGWLYGMTDAGGEHGEGVLFGYHIPQRRFEVLWHLCRTPLSRKKAKQNRSKEVPTTYSSDIVGGASLLWHPQGALYYPFNQFVNLFGQERSADSSSSEGTPSGSVQERKVYRYWVKERRWERVVFVLGEEPVSWRDYHSWSWFLGTDGRIYGTDGRVIYRWEVGEEEGEILYRLPYYKRKEEYGKGEAMHGIGDFVFGEDGYVYAWNWHYVYGLNMQTGEWRLLLRYDEAIE